MMFSDNLPSFIAVGPQRTATTWLHEALEGHVHFPSGVYEPMFFDRHYKRGWSWYQAHFRHCDGSKPVGEVAPTYFHSAEARQRIAHAIPECKIICTLRDPVDRLYSLYRLMREYGMTRLSFEDALEAEPVMLESSRYAFHVRAWFECFGREQVKVVFNEALYKNPQHYLDDICQFLGMDTVALPAERWAATPKELPARNYYLARAAQTVGDLLRGWRLYWLLNAAKALHLKKIFVGQGEDLPPMAAETAVRLRSRLLPEVEALESLLEVDLGHWKPSGFTDVSAE